MRKILVLFGLFFFTKAWADPKPKVSVWGGGLKAVVISSSCSTKIFVDERLPDDMNQKRRFTCKAAIRVSGKHAIASVWSSLSTYIHMKDRVEKRCRLSDKTSGKSTDTWSKKGDVVYVESSIVSPYMNPKTHPHFAMYDESVCSFYVSINTHKVTKKE